MKIGIVTTWFERGAAYVSRQYRDLLRKMGHDVYLFGRGGERYAIGNPLWDTPDVTWGTKDEEISTGINQSEFAAWIKATQISAILFNEQVWLPPVAWARELGVLSIGYIDYYTEATVSHFSIYDALICNTKRHMSVFDWHPQVLYLPWGTDIDLFKPLAPDCVRQDGPVFFHSGGMNPHRKGSDLVLAAFAQLKGTAHLLLHTQASLAKFFPSNYSYLHKIITTTPNITLVEKDITAPGLYHMGDIYVYPSRLDGIGLTPIEASACGLPAIVPDNPPMNEFVTAENGFTIPIKKLWSRADGYYWPQCEVDLKALILTMQAMVTTFSMLPDFKRKARSYAEKHFNWFDRGEQLNTWLQHLRPLEALLQHKPSEQALNLQNYWAERKSNADSGLESYNRLAMFKAEVINAFIKSKHINTTIEFGTGDGSQLSLLITDNYMGFDVSDTLIGKLGDQFDACSGKKVLNVREYAGQTAELTLSIDIIYYLAEDSAFDSYMHRLFDAATKYVIIYSTNTNDNSQNKAEHMKHRKFTQWISKYKNGWKCIDFIKNQYPLCEGNEAQRATPHCDFYIFEKTNK